MRIRTAASTAFAVLVLGCAAQNRTATAPMPGAGRLYGLSELTSRPRLLNASEIGCELRSLRPLTLRYAASGGTTTLDITLDPLGRVERVQVHQASGIPDIDAAATRVGERMRFEPGRVYGSAVRCRFTLPLSIHLSDAPALPRSPGSQLERGCL